MEAASTMTAELEGGDRENWNDYLEKEDDGDLRSEKLMNPEEQSIAAANLDPELWSRLTGGMKEKIIARLPFKALFRAASLSRAWSQAFSAPSFQREVMCSSCPFWRSYSPLFCTEEQQLLGFEGESQRWHRLPTHLGGWDASGRTWRLKSSGGSLLCWTDGAVGPSLSGSPALDHIRVSNPLNGSWRELPPPPETGCWAPIFDVVCERDAYQVVLFSPKNMQETGRIFMRVFDSKSGSWSFTSHDHDGLEMEWGDTVLLNGAIYLLSNRRCTGCYLVSFHVTNKSWNKVEFVLEDADRRSASSRLIVPNVLEFRDVFYSQLVVCGSELVLVAHYTDGIGSDDDESSHESIALFEVHPELGVGFRLAVAPREMLMIGALHGAVGHGDSLYIFGRNPSSLAIRYDLKPAKWNLFPVVSDTVSAAVDFTLSPRWIHSTYTPGSNPFFKV